MQSSNAQQEPTTGSAQAVVETMQRRGVAPLPRNYEIFYEASAGSNLELREAVERLGQRPPQGELDQIAHRFFAQSSQAGIVDNAHQALMMKIEAVMELLRRERASLEKYGIILDQTSAGLDKRHEITTELLRRIVSIMATATDTTIAQGRQIATSIADTSAELAEVKAKLTEYKVLADTDALTRISNRRAFDRAMAEIYGDTKKVMFSALIIADVDRFKEINDRFGHPVGDRVLQQIARILRTSVNLDVFVARTGGEEFAIIVEGLTEEGTVSLADDIRAIIEKTQFAPVGQQAGVTVSMGVCMATEADGPEDLYSKADQALYASKAAGRNRVSRYPASTPGLQRKNWMIYRTD